MHQANDTGRRDAPAIFPGLVEPIGPELQGVLQGFRRGQRVRVALGRDLAGRIRSFCVDGEGDPAAIVKLETPSNAWGHVEKLVNLRPAPLPGEAAGMPELSRVNRAGVDAVRAAAARLGVRP